MEIIQVRVNDKLAQLLDAAVKTGMYSNRSEAVRDAIRKLFAPELKEEVLAEIAKRSSSKEFVTQEEVEKEFGLA